MKYRLLASFLAICIQFSSNKAIAELFHDSLGTANISKTNYSESLTLSPDDSLKFSSEKASPVTVISDDFLKFTDATLYTLASPVRWKGKDWLKFGGVIAGIGAVSLADKKNQGFWTRENSAAWHNIEQAGFYYGKPHTAVIISGGFYLSGLVAKNEWLRETGLILGSTFVTTAALRTALKPLVGRGRPYLGEGNYSFKPLTNTSGYNSFPSGHMAVATSISFVLAKRINHPVAKAGFYTLAGTTLISRMYSNSHWLSDLVMGGAITWFSTETIIKRLESKFKKPGNKVAWEICPTSRGVTFIGTFK